MSNTSWYLALGGHQVGPLTDDDLRHHLENGSADGKTLCWSPGMKGWTPLEEVPAFAAFARGGGGAPPPAMPSVPGRQAHDIDFKIHGAEMQFVEVELDPGECAIAEAGTMMYMTQAIGMQTVFGDGNSAQQGFFDKLLGAGKRLLTGESLFMTVFQHQGQRGKERVAFAAPYAGKILPMDLQQLGGRLLCQKDSFLCAARGVSVGIAFQKRIGVGLFGGEGFIMQKLEGDGLAFVHAGGTVHALDLAPGETLRVDTGCIVALQPQVDFDIQFVGGIKTALFGGEGLFFATLRGPGRVWLQSLPFSRLADRIVTAARGARREEGSVLDRAFGLGNLIDGDS
ncbi:MAG: TIGR00266 family protein [Planctomycetes bacterium]|nr:TIGR00266 family protein [Planctomycetota bacterium]